MNCFISCLVIVFATVTLVWQEPVDGSKVAYTGTKPILRTGLQIKGNKSLVTSVDPEIKGNKSLVTGVDPEIKGNKSLVTGVDPEIKGNESLVTGVDPEIKGNKSVVTGVDTGIKGNKSLVNGGFKNELNVSDKNVGPHVKTDGDPIEDNRPLEYSYFRRKKGKSALPNKPVLWAHCTQLITPYVKKWRTEEKLAKYHTHEHHEVQRIVHLIKINTTQYSNQEVYAMLIQFSKVQFRIYNWDISAIRYLLNNLITGKEQSFRQLKRGVKNLFTRWRLDFSNTSSLLTYSKIIRPMCLRAPSIDLSTKNPKADEFVATPKTTTLGRCQSDEYGSCI